MNRIIEKYGRVAVVCTVAAIMFSVFGGIGMQLYKKTYYSKPENAGNVDENMRLLAAQKRYPFFTGSRYITLTLGYQGIDGQEGFSKEDALSFIEAYEYETNGLEGKVKGIDKNRIKVYPFDDENKNNREFVNVNKTGKYSIRYCVEGESGLKADMTMLVLVDILPQGMEYTESAGVANESGS